MSHAKSPTLEGILASGTTASHLPMSQKGETIENWIKQLPPHGKQDCVTQAWKYETIDKLISRIPTSEGLYKLFWMLTQKAKNVDLGLGHRAMINKKAHTAVDKAIHLLAIELNLAWLHIVLLNAGQSPSYNLK